MNNNNEEIWKDIPGYENFYQVSNLARVRSVDRFVPNRLIGDKFFIRKERSQIIKPNTDTNGYAFIKLSKDSQKKYIRLNRLLARVFIPNSDNLPVVNHKNGIKKDNRLENLEWCTHSYNVKHAYKNKLKKIPIGELNGNHKLTTDQVISIRQDFSQNKISCRELSKKYAVKIGTIYCIIQRRIWKHI